MIYVEIEVLRRYLEFKGVEFMTVTGSDSIYLLRENAGGTVL